VDNNNPPNCSTIAADPEAVALPASLADQLVNTLHLSSEEVAMLSLGQAVAKMAEPWATPAE
jgi:hypothetical protein